MGWGFFLLLIIRIYFGPPYLSYLFYPPRFCFETVFSNDPALLENNFGSNSVFSNILRNNSLKVVWKHFFMKGYNVRVSLFCRISFLQSYFWLRNFISIFLFFSLRKVLIKFLIITWKAISTVVVMDSENGDASFNDCCTFSLGHAWLACLLSSVIKGRLNSLM